MEIIDAESVSSVIPREPLGLSGPPQPRGLLPPAGGSTSATPTMIGGRAGIAPFYQEFPHQLGPLHGPDVPPASLTRNQFGENLAPDIGPYLAAERGRTMEFQQSIPPRVSRFPAPGARRPIHDLLDRITGNLNSDGLSGPIQADILFNRRNT